MNWISLIIAISTSVIISGTLIYIDAKSRHNIIKSQMEEYKDRPRYRLR